MSDFDHMMAQAMLAYHRLPGSVGKSDMRENRVEIAEALAGQLIETRETRRRAVDLHLEIPTTDPQENRRHL